MTKSSEENDLWTYGILGAVGSAIVGLLISALAKSPPNFQNGYGSVNSYQATPSYTAPPPPKQGGCGCNAASR